MKRHIITFCLLLCCLVVCAQSFEGEIIYKNSYKSRTPGTTDGEYSIMAGTLQNYYIKGGNYRSETNGTLILWQIYINKDKKIYSKIAHSPTILWDDATVNNDKITSTEVHKGVVTILGYLCDEVILHNEQGNYQKYYFNSKLAIDSKLYTNHLYGSWYAYLSKANAVPLKIMIRSSKYFFESTATEIKHMKLADSFFTLPQGAKTEKSPF
jgi:hypothetical protein